MIFDKIPSIKEKWFIRNGRGGRYKDYGGYSPCCTGYKEIYEGCSLNNCVGGAWGLFAKAENNPNCKIGFLSCDWCPDGAGSWWNNGKSGGYDTYERGTTPKEGAVICYSSGHVAYVNEILENGDLKLISSGWGNMDNAGLEYRIVSPKDNYKWTVGTSVKGFQGFIYPKREEPTDDKDKKIAELQEKISNMADKIIDIQADFNNKINSLLGELR